MSEDLASDIRKQLDTITRLLAALVAAQHSTLSEKALTLSSLGLSRTEIALVCNSTANAVSVRLAEARQKNRKKSSGGSKKAR